MIYSRFKCIVILILLCFLLQVPAFAEAVASSQVPLDSWVYPALDKLSALGLVDSSLQGNRPYTRYEVARQTEAALATARHRDLTPAISGLLMHLEAELADTLNDLRSDSVAGYLKFREAQLDYIYKDGEDAVIAGHGILASQFPLNYNNYGLDYRKQNAQLILQGEARLGSSLLVDLRPLLSYANGDDNSEADLSLLEGRVVLQLGGLEISAGRQSLWWGQGRHGSLVLTNNSKPMDMVRLTNPVPGMLPWVLKYLGPFRFDLFWSRLEEDRAVAEPYFAGIRLDLKPLPWIELGASRTIMFGGEGRPDVGWDDFITILGGKNLSGSEDTSNSVAAMDARLRLPFLWGAEIYGEYGGEDEADHFIAAAAWMAGVYLPQIEPTQRLSLRLEYADFSKIDNLAPPWYRHGIYRSGYTYDGKILGHHVGGAAKDTYLEIEALLSNSLTLTLGFDYEERGFDQPVLEKYRLGSLAVLWGFAEHYTLDSSLQYGDIENFGFIDGQNEDSFMLSVGLRGHW